MQGESASPPTALLCQSQLDVHARSPGVSATAILYDQVWVGRDPASLPWSWVSLYREIIAEYTYALRAYIPREIFG
jgi:hypothetical protein